MTTPPHETTDRRIHSPGKSTFLKFMLACLISAQVVLQYTVSMVRLFFDGKVYSRPASRGLEGLPVHRNAPYSPIWALIDMDLKKQEPPVDPETNVWPIQASSPDPIRGGVRLQLVLPFCYVVRYRFVADCPSPLQFKASARIQRIAGQTGEISPACESVAAPFQR